jgi:hypothetical protein
MTNTKYLPKQGREDQALRARLRVILGASLFHNFYNFETLCVFSIVIKFDLFLSAKSSRKAR